MQKKQGRLFPNPVQVQNFYLNCSHFLPIQVMGGVSGGGHQTAAEGHIMLIGNMCLLINTLASAVYYLGAKKLVQVRLKLRSKAAPSVIPHCATIFASYNGAS